MTISKRLKTILKVNFYAAHCCFELIANLRVCATSVSGIQEFSVNHKRCYIQNAIRLVPYEVVPSQLMQMIQANILRGLFQIESAMLFKFIVQGSAH